MTYTLFRDARINAPGKQKQKTDLPTPYHLSMGGLGRLQVRRRNDHQSLSPIPAVAIPIHNTISRRHAQQRYYRNLISSDRSSRPPPLVLAIVAGPSIVVAVAAAVILFNNGQGKRVRVQQVKRRRRPSNGLLRHRRCGSGGEGGGASPVEQGAAVLEMRVERDAGGDRLLDEERSVAFLGQLRRQPVVVVVHFLQDDHVAIPPEDLFQKFPPASYACVHSRCSKCHCAVADAHCQRLKTGGKMYVVW